MSGSDGRARRLRRMAGQWWFDLRYAARTLLRQPGFLATAVATLAIGIGATTAVFGVVERELWRPLPFEEPQQLVAIYATNPGARISYDRASRPEFLAWRDQSRSLAQIAAYGGTTRRLLRRPGTAPLPLTVLPVTSGFFTLLGRTPARGRAFEGERDPGTVVVSDAAWRRVFGADPNIVGSTVTLDEEPVTIVGIDRAAALEFVPIPDVYSPLDVAASQPGDRKTRDLRVIGRLRPETDAPSAQAELRTVADRLAQAFPDEQQGRSVVVEDLRTSYTGWNWRPLYFLLGAAIVVLVLTCVNVANLMLARALGRIREFAIRRALGGGGLALARQLLTEAGLLALLGAGAGLLLSSWIVAALPAWLPPDYLSREGPITLNTRVYLFAFGLAAICALAMGLAPAIMTSRRDLAPTLCDGGRAAAGSPRQRRARNALVVAQVTIALVLLVGAGLFTKSVRQLVEMPLGFEPEGRLTMRVPLIGGRYAEPATISQVAGDLLERTRALPGITSTALGTSVPLASGPVARFARADRPRPRAGEEARAIVRAVSPRYFDTLAIPQLAGRDFSPDDRPGSPRVAIVNQQLARRIFGSENPIGRQLDLFTSPLPWIPAGPVEIVGVVGNAKEVGINEVEFNGIYLPLAQSPSASLLLIARSDLPTEAIVAALRREVYALDPGIPQYGVVAMQQRVDEALQADRFHRALIAAFAALAVLMAALGVYGAIAQSVQQRTREFGVRLALGARPRGIFALALGYSARLGLAGATLGAAAAVVLARAIGDALFLVPGEHNGLLYGVSLTDPATLIGAFALLVAVATCAGAVPARRATRVDPLTALRCD